jgi:hypothetical protein
MSQNLRQYANSGVNYTEKSLMKLATGHSMGHRYVLQILFGEK